MSEITTKQLDDLVLDYVQKREIYEAAKKISNDKNADMEAAEFKLLTALKTAKKKNYAVQNVGTVTHVEKYAVRVPGDPEKKKLFFNYLREQGDELYFAMATVNYNTLNSFYAAETEAAEAKGIFPFSIPGIEEPTLSESVSFRKDKSNGNEAGKKTGERNRTTTKTGGGDII